MPQFQTATLPAPNVVDTLVPSKNPNALIAYYIGLFSILPFVGVPMGIAAIVLGIRGLKECKRNPTVRGKTHAWVGIITGTLFGGIWLLLTVGLIILFVQRPR